MGTTQAERAAINPGAPSATKKKRGGNTMITMNAKERFLVGNIVKTMADELLKNPRSLEAIALELMALPEVKGKVRAINANAVVSVMKLIGNDEEFWKEYSKLLPKIESSRKNRYKVLRVRISGLEDRMAHTEVNYQAMVEWCQEAGVRERTLEDRCLALEARVHELEDRLTAPVAMGKPSDRVGQPIPVPKGDPSKGANMKLSLLARSPDNGKH